MLRTMQRPLMPLETRSLPLSLGQPISSEGLKSILEAGGAPPLCVPSGTRASWGILVPVLGHVQPMEDLC